MSQVEALLLHQLNLLAAAVILLVLFSVACASAAVTLARAWQQATNAVGELRAWYRGHGEQRTVESLMRAQVKREMNRAHSQPVLPSGTRQRDAEPAFAPTVRSPSSRPAPLDETWPSGPAPESPKLSAKVARAKLNKALTARPPPLPDPGDHPDDWQDNDLRTEEVSLSMLIEDGPGPGSAEPFELTQQSPDKRTWVWPKAKPKPEPPQPTE